MFGWAGGLSCECGRGGGSGSVVYVCANRLNLLADGNDINVIRAIAPRRQHKLVGRLDEYPTERRRSII